MTRGKQSLAATINVLACGFTQPVDGGALKGAVVVVAGRDGLVVHVGDADADGSDDGGVGGAGVGGAAGHVDGDRVKGAELVEHDDGGVAVGDEEVVHGWFPSLSDERPECGRDGVGVEAFFDQPVDELRCPVGDDSDLRVCDLVLPDEQRPEHLSQVGLGPVGVEARHLAVDDDPLVHVGGQRRSDHVADVVVAVDGEVGAEVLADAVGAERAAVVAGADQHGVVPDLLFDGVCDGGVHGWFPSLLCVDTLPQV